MTSSVKSPYTKEQISIWLRGLLTIAWCDGRYDPREKKIIADLTQNLAVNHLHKISYESFDKSVTIQELSTSFGYNSNVGENFLRTAVIVAIADGIYSRIEADLLNEYSRALGLKIDALEYLKYTLCEFKISNVNLLHTQDASISSRNSVLKPNVLQPVKNWLDEFNFKDPRLARFICKMIPSQCPFEKDVKLFSHKVIYIPPLCKLNPLYEQLVRLRFRALCYLVNECQEDVSSFT
ncbi:MAG: nitrogenase [Candidatus Atelocyanobacterium thalassa]|uniref:Tellurite resistance protein n=1 Tax=Candidatus Atelocyanobacterium thalassa isolate SIO64986 TaxID=1527444 RepID=A0A086CI17_9CHRO|nr:MAG: tellurite resistance protein [Candidatus Atelocyanobacterium thalassa isolate SIO64986]